MQTDEERRLRALPARAPLELASELAELNARELKGDAVRAPRVTLHLRSGRDVAGVVLAASREGVVVQTGGGATRHDPPRDATYVQLGSVEAITVHAAPAHFEQLSGGRPSPFLEDAPTLLAARRALEEHRKAVAAHLGVELTWSAVGIESLGTGEPIRALVELSRRAAVALESAAGDDMGKHAIATRVRRVTLRAGETAGVTLDGDQLSFSAPLERGATAVPDVAELTSNVEALF